MEILQLYAQEKIDDMLRTFLNDINGQTPANENNKLILTDPPQDIRSTEIRTHRLGNRTKITIAGHTTHALPRLLEAVDAQNEQYAFLSLLHPLQALIDQRLNGLRIVKTGQRIALDALSQAFRWAAMVL